MSNYSRQRDAIKEYLYQTNSHPTAEEVYQHVRETCPNISLGTVYRNLALLSSEGELKKISCPDDIDRYDTRMTPHSHLVCSKCGKIEDIEYTLPEALDEEAGQGYEGQITGHTVMFYGLCSSCAKEKREQTPDVQTKK